MSEILALGRVSSRLDQASQLLTGTQTTDAVAEARWRLEEVQARLAVIARHQHSAELATRIERIRDALGGHLVAAHDCEIAKVRIEVIAEMLRRGATTVAADLDALAAQPVASAIA